jgi:hypothetical protein
MSSVSMVITSKNQSHLKEGNQQQQKKVRMKHGRRGEHERIDLDWSQ